MLKVVPGGSVLHVIYSRLRGTPSRIDSERQCSRLGGDASASRVDAADLVFKCGKWRAKGFIGSPIVVVDFDRSGGPSQP